MIAAEHGQPLAEQLARRLGSSETLPSPVSEALLMKLQPRDAPPGHAEICGPIVS